MVEAVRGAGGRVDPVKSDDFGHVKGGLSAEREVLDKKIDVSQRADVSRQNVPASGIFGDGNVALPDAD